MKHRDSDRKRVSLDLAGLYLGSAWVLLAPSVAVADQVTSIPGGSAVSMPNRGGVSTATMGGSTFTIGGEVGVDISVSSNSSNALFGYTGGYGLCANGAWTGSPPYAGTNGSAAVSITFRFEDGDVESVGGFLNYAPSGCTGSGSLVIEALDVNGNVIETYTPLISTPSAVNQGAFFGISRSQRDIAAFRISGGFAVLRNLTFAGYEAYDVTPPTLNIVGPVATQTGPFVVSFNFSEDVVGFAQGDVSVSNGSLSNFSGSGSSYSATVTPAADGTVGLTVAAATYEDAAGNDNAGASVYSVGADITAPTVTASGPAGPVNGAFVANFAFSESVNNFIASDIQVANGAVSNFSGGGSAFTATITPTTDGVVSISIPAAAAQDGAGNNSVANANALSLVADLTAPVVNAGADIAVDTDPGQPTAVVTYSVSANDPGNGALTPVLLSGLASGSAFPIGVTVVEYSATDAAGNTATDSLTVTVSDGEDPVIAGMPSNLVLPAEPGLPTAVASWTAPTVSDNAPGATIAQTTGPASGAAFPIGVTVVTYQAQDASGRTVTASFTVTVQDTQAPIIISPPSNVTVGTDAGQPTAVVNWTEPTVSDNAPGASITRTSGPAPGSAFPIGTTTITYTAQDAAGNTATASFDIAVEDNEPPAINGLPANIAVNTDSGQPTAVVSWTPPTASDNDAVTITQTAGPPPGWAFALGTTTITYLAEDASGNQVSASFTVTVSDAEPPAIVGLPADIATSTDAGQPTAIVNWTAPTVSDNAAGASITQTAGPAPGSAFPIGTTTITYTAQDGAGNATSASFNVVVEDNEAPVINGLPANIAVNTDGGQPTAVVSWTLPTVSDNDSATITQTAGLAPGSAFPIGVTTITYVAEDASGNQVSASFTVTVADAEPPAIVSLPSDIVASTDPGMPTAVVNWTPPSVSDNAAGASISQTAGPAPGSAFAIGATTITYTAQDAAGNSTSASFTVTVEDGEPPVITNLPADIAVNTDAGQPTAVVNWTPPGVSDNTSGATIVQTAGPAPGSAFPVGATTITYQAEDAAGNVTTQSFMVTVTDAEPPVFVNFPANIAITLDYPSTSAVASWTPPTASDNVPGATVTQIAGPAPGSTFALGVTTITYRVADVNGNVVEQSFTVSVVQTPPGQVRLVVESGADGVFTFSSPEPSFNVSITTVNGDGSVVIPIRPGVFSVNFVTPTGFGVMEASCDDPDSSLNAETKSGSITVESNGTVTCTLVAVDSLNDTSRMIGAFLGARAALIMQNMPDSDRRIDRLRGAERTPGGVSAFGLNAGRGELPFDLSFGHGNAEFSFSLAGLRARNRDTRDNERAAWGQGQHASDWTAAYTPEADFSGFGFVGGGAAPEAASSAAVTESGTRSPPEDGASPFDVWVEGSYAEFETSLGEGDFSMLSIGADWVTRDSVLIGVSVQFDRTDMTGELPGSSISGTGYLFGPYVTAQLSDRLFFDGQAAIGRSSNEISPYGTYEDKVNADRMYLSGALIGDFEAGPWTFRPEGRVTYFREEMEAYVDSLAVAIPAIEVAIGEFEFSPTVSYTFTNDDDSVFRPYASLDGIWTFSQENGAAFALGADPAVDEGVRGRVEGGFDYAQAGGMQMSLSGFYDGIGDADLTSWGARFRVAWSFEP